MILWQRVMASTGENVGEPGALPEHLIGLADGTLANLPAAFGEATLAQLQLEDAGFLPVEVPAPPAPRRELPKSTVQERVNAVGKLDEAFAVLNAQPIYFGRWFAPDWPNVYADDEGLLAVLADAGCTADEIATITA